MSLLKSSNYNKLISTVAATDASAPPMVSFRQLPKRRVPLKRPPFRLPSTLVFGRTPVTRFYKVPFPVAGVNTTEPMDEAMFAEVTHGPTDPESTILVASERLTWAETVLLKIQDWSTMETMEEGRVGVIEVPKLSREEQFPYWDFERGCLRSNSKPKSKAMRFFCLMLALAAAFAFAFASGKATQSAALNLHGKMQPVLKVVWHGNETAQQLAFVTVDLHGEMQPVSKVVWHGNETAQQLASVAVDCLDASNATKQDDSKAVTIFKSGASDVSRELFEMFLAQPSITFGWIKEDLTKALVPFTGFPVKTMAFKSQQLDDNDKAVAIFQSHAGVSLDRSVLDLLLAKPLFAFDFRKFTFSMQPLLMIAAPPSNPIESVSSAAVEPRHGWSQLMVHGEGQSLGSAKVKFEFLEDETTGNTVHIDCEYNDNSPGWFKSKTVALAQVTLVRSHDPFAGRELLTVGFGDGRFSVTVVCSEAVSSESFPAPMLSKGAKASSDASFKSDASSCWRLYHVLIVVWVALCTIGKREGRRRFFEKRRRQAAKAAKAMRKAALEEEQRSMAALEEQQRSIAALEEQQRSMAALEEQQRGMAALEQQQRGMAALEQQQRGMAALEQQQRGKAALEEQQRGKTALEAQQQGSKAQCGRHVHFSEQISVRSFDRTVGCRMRQDLIDGRPPELEGYQLGLDWTFEDSNADLDSFGHGCSRQNHSGYRVHSGLARRQILLTHGLALQEIESLNWDDRMSYLADLDAFFAKADDDDDDDDAAGY
ncbi:hypothetical protein MPSEU_001014400 [Mayamaea pseudoterrestris]|nr:hypothetical protein MPSEU_001014400 [Mayamaea pseudoterrestris]